ncbi:flavin reductase family protein [Streptacidiphilus cavernicola]|uniref:Flavin reductase family protein n=1 Tax=Streptacidiphilus cavernicola TaxID=3342716 RepID=A0ABV6VNI8_9ACTN
MDIRLRDHLCEDPMGHEGMAVAAVRYLRTAAGPSAPLPAPAPVLRAVGPDERLPDAAADPRVLRSVLGHFCTGVTVVSALARDGAPVGFACQSFSSLSLDPPLVSFNVARSSASWPRIAHAGHFCVNVLAADQGDLCRTFAVSGATGADKFAGVDWSPADVTGSPRIAGALAWIDCTIHAVHVGGDHLIVLGRVCDLSVERSDSGPLLFYRGGFGGLTP